MWQQEYRADKDGVKLYMFRKRRDAPVAGEAPRPVLFSGAWLVLFRTQRLRPACPGED